MPEHNSHSETSTGRDVLRTIVLLASVAAQTVAGALGGSGALDEPVGAVANSYPTLVLPGGGAFAIWSVIYAAGIVLAVRAALPRQRGRTVHRRIGWWLAAGGLLNAGWIVVFTQRWMVVAEVVIVALLVVLGVVVDRLSSSSARGWADRLLLHTPIGVYAGWVSAAAVAGAATTAAALGISPAEPVAVVLAVAAMAGTAALAAVAISRINAAAGYGAAVAWALAWVAAATPAWHVAVSAAVGALVTLAVVARRSLAAERPTRALWG